MQNVRIVLIATLLTFISIVLNSQSDATIHIDKPFYVTGEVAWYKIYLPSGFENISGKIKAIVQGNNNQVVDESFVQLEKSMISGYYKIPFDLKSGLYHFSFYGLENKTFDPIKILEFEVPIYNDLNGEGLQPIFPQEDLMGYIPNASSGNLNLNLTSDKESYSLSEKVRLSAEVRNSDGELVPANLSISVVDKGLIGKSLETGCVFSKPIQLKFGVMLGLDERTYVQGNIYDANDNPVKISVIGAFNSEENKMFYSRSDESGKFTILMKDQLGRSKLQIAGYLYEEYADTRINLRAEDPVTTNIAMTSQYDDDITSYLEVSNKRKRIYQHFNQLENEIIIKDYAKNRSEVRPNKTFKINEYVNFETVGKFFDEILGSQLNFLKSGDKITARMFNPESNKNGGRSDDYYFLRSPVFIVDGKITKDAQFIYNMKSDNVDMVELYYDWRDITKQFGTFGEFGYVIIKTNQRDFKLPQGDEEDIISYTGLQPIVEFPVQISEKDRSFPAFKPLLYWQPNHFVKDEKTKEIEFLTSDDISSFEVVVVARTLDGIILQNRINLSTVMAN